MAESAAVGYASSDDSRRTRRLRSAPRPAWARPSGSFRDHSEAEALYFAGGALSALDSVVQSDPPWAGVWRHRLALKSAAAVGENLLNRREDEAALRDAVALMRPGQELGPAGRVYGAFRVLARPGDPFRPERLAAVAADLQSPIDLERAGKLAAALETAGARGGRPRRGGRGRSLGDACAPTPSRSPCLRRRGARCEPELAGPRALACRRAVFRRASGEGRRPRPGEAGWGKLVALVYARAALAALDLAQDLSRRKAGSGRRAKTARQGQEQGARGAARRRRDLRRRAHAELE